MPRVAVLHTPRELTPNLEHVSPGQIELMSKALQGAGWQVSLVEYAPHSLAADLDRCAPDLVFHLAYGYTDSQRGLVERQAQIAARLEALGMSCVGSTSVAQALAQDKLATGEHLAAAGIATPRLVPRRADQARAVVLKPRRGGCHRGVRVVQVAAGEEVAVPATEEYVVQEYIDGPEFTVGVLEEDGGLTVLPPVQVLFDCPARTPHVMVWEDYPWTYEFDSGRGLGLEEVAARAFRSLGLCDYARFDLRVDPERGPVLLDANSLPNLDPGISLLPAAARHAGRDYTALIRGMAANAHRRARHRPTGAQRVGLEDYRGARG